MAKTLVVGYGNVDREDDGVAWHILHSLAGRLGISTGSMEESEASFLSGDLADLLFVLQLTPELGEQLAEYEQVCFVDAHTGEIAEDLQFIEIQPEFQKSPLTHHMTPQTCLAIARDLYGHEPRGYLVSVRGYQFGFAQVLSERTAALADQATAQIEAWINRTG